MVNEGKPLAMGHYAHGELEQSMYKYKYKMSAVLAQSLSRLDRARGMLDHQAPASVAIEGRFSAPADLLGTPVQQWQGNGRSAEAQGLRERWRFMSLPLT
jgi:hypothetical protein